jgi:hypothetical protein
MRFLKQIVSANVIYTCGLLKKIASANVIYTGGWQSTACEKGRFLLAPTLAALKNASANSSRTTTIELLCTSGGAWWCTPPLHEPHTRRHRRCPHCLAYVDSLCILDAMHASTVHAAATTTNGGERVKKSVGPIDRPPRCSRFPQSGTCAPLLLRSMLLHARVNISFRLIN